MRDESLNLEVRDFGPIGEARVELRPLTVFVGPSNTGKSYLAMLIYALHKHFSQFDSKNWWHAEDMVRRILLESGEQLALDVRKTREAWTKEDKKRQSQQHSVDVMQSHNWELSGAFKELIRGVVGTQSNVLREEIERCFGASLKQLTRKAKHSKFTMLVNRQPETAAGQNPDCVQFGYSGVSLGISIPDRFDIEVKGARRLVMDMEIEFERFNALVKNDPKIAELLELPILFDVLREIVSPGLFGLFGWPAHYLPAGRAELLDSFDLVVGSMIQKSSSSADSENRVPGTKSDFLQKLMSLGRLIPNERDSVLTSIEEEILEGSISIQTDDKIKFPQFSFRPANWGGQELPLKNASSMVSEVGPISLYEKYIVKQNQLLIVDEPESHLHPELQVKLFRQLAALVNEGKRVMVTTHSEWVAEELSNIVRRSEISATLNRVAESRPGQGKVSITRDKVGVWLFDRSSKAKGSSVQEVAMEDTGLYATQFDDVANALHNEWARISSTIRKDDE